MVIKIRNASKATHRHHFARIEMNRFCSCNSDMQWICVCVCEKGRKNWINVRARNQVEKAASFLHPKFFYSIPQQQLDASVMQTIFAIFFIFCCILTMRNCVWFITYSVMLSLSRENAEWWTPLLLFAATDLSGLLITRIVMSFISWPCLTAYVYSIHHED